MVGPGETGRIDPYRSFRFKLGWDGRYVAGFSKCSTLEHTNEAVAYRQSSDVSSSPPLGTSKNQPITLERGVTHDNDFEQWASNL